MATKRSQKTKPKEEVDPVAAIKALGERYRPLLSGDRKPSTEIESDFVICYVCAFRFAEYSAALEAKLVKFLMAQEQAEESKHALPDNVQVVTFGAKSPTKKGGRKK